MVPEQGTGGLRGQNGRPVRRPLDPRGGQPDLLGDLVEGAGRDEVSIQLSDGTGRHADAAGGTNLPEARVGTDRIGPLAQKDVLASTLVERQQDRGHAQEPRARRDGGLDREADVGVSPGEDLTPQLVQAQEGEDLPREEARVDDRQTVPLPASGLAWLGRIFTGDHHTQRGLAGQRHDLHQREIVVTHRRTLLLRVHRACFLSS